MTVLKDESGKEYKFETYNGLLVQEGAVTAINNRVTAERTQHETKYTELENKFKELGTQHEELRVKQMTAEERAADAEAKREQKEKELIADRDKNRALYKNHKIETELFKGLAGFKSEAKIETYDDSQVLKLLRAEYDDIDLANNDTEVVFKKGNATINVKDAFKNFLEAETNANLVKSGLNPGSGTQTNVQKQQSKMRTQFKRSEVADTGSEAAVEYRAAMKAGLRPTLTDD